jgi:hypothetical protein
MSNKAVQACLNVTSNIKALNVCTYLLSKDCDDNLCCAATAAAAVAAAASFATKRHLRKEDRQWRPWRQPCCSC